MKCANAKPMRARRLSPQAAGVLPAALALLSVAMTGPAPGQATPPGSTTPASAAPPTSTPGRDTTRAIVAPPVSTAQGLLSLSATFGTENRVIPSGLTWRVFAAGEAEPAAQSSEAAPSFTLKPGDYVVHVTYGLASATRRLAIGTGSLVERLPIAAGAIMLRGVISDQPIPLTRLSVSVFIPSPGNSEDRLIASNLKGGEVLRLPEGVYHVVSSYGDSNSIVRADIRVQAGKVTEATMNHRAATITLKLVSNPGGEALANTAWSVLTPGGDVIREAIGAFPSVTLAEGEYIAIARNDGRAFQGDFRVRSGYDRDIEVIARNGQAVGARER